MILDSGLLLLGHPV